MHISPATALAKAGGVLESSIYPAGVLPGQITAMAVATVEQMQSQRQDFHASITEVMAAADGANRDLTDDEIEQIQTSRSEIDRLGRQIEARQAAVIPGIANVEQGTRRRTTDANPNPTARVAAAPRGPVGRQGWTSFGEFALAVRAASVQNGQLDGRLTNAATTYGNEGTGTDGGFAVPPDFQTQIWTKVLEGENLMTRCASLTTAGNSMTVPKDETTPWQTSGGIQVYWEYEAAVVTASKPALEMTNIRLQKLMALVPLSDELIEDAVGLESYLRAKVPAKMTAKINTAIISGSGVSMPLGILNAPSRVTVTKETSQAADTILFANINKMWARMYAPARRNAVWLINQDVEPQLNSMAFDPAASSKVPVYLPTNGLSVEGYATLMGRPVVPVEACSTIGDEGDIILADLSQYEVLTKGGGAMREDVSMHLYFDQGLTAYRFTFRMNGQPMWGRSITPQNGTFTRSWAVTLQAR